MTSSVVYDGELRTVCTHLQSGTEIETDAPTDNNGKGERFSPTDLMATSYATCVLTIMGIKAKSMDIDLKGLKVDVKKIMKPDPRRVAGINLTFLVPQELLSIDDKTKTILKNVAQTCPVAYSIHPDIEVNIDWGNWA